MFKRITPEKVAGIVALSYLVLIPVGGVLAYQKLQALDEDVRYLWANQELLPDERTRSFSLADLKRKLLNR